MRASKTTVVIPPRENKQTKLKRAAAGVASGLVYRQDAFLCSMRMFQINPKDTLITMKWTVKG